MPQRTESQIIGDRGETWLLSHLPPGWILQPPKIDVGVDGVVVICDNTDLNGREFRVQVKASTIPTIRDGTIIVGGIKKSTVEYWFLSPLPTLLVFYDAHFDRGYFRWHSDAYDDMRPALERKDAQSLSISIPLANQLTPEGWENVRNSLRVHYVNLSEAIRALRDAQSLLPTIHNLASAVRQLNYIDHQTIPLDKRTNQQEGLLALMELMQHRLVVSTLSALLLELVTDSDGARTLQAWIHMYESSVSSVFPTFEKLAVWDHVEPDFQMEYDRGNIHQKRHKLIEHILEMIMLLAPGQFSKKG